MMLRVLAVFYVVMAAAGCVVELACQPLGLVQTTHNVTVVSPHIALNRDTYLNIVAIALTAVLAARFFVTGVPECST